MPGTLFVVATPIGNLEDITLRGLRILRESTLIAAEDTRRTAHLLARHGIATPTTSLHEHNESRKAAALIDRLRAGDDIALVSDAGTPTISDPGTELIRAAIASGIRVEPIPGPSAITAILSVSGLSTDSFTFLGFPPTRSKDRKHWMQRLGTLSGVAVFYEAPHRIDRTLADIIAAIGDRAAVVGRELTKAHEELVRGPISTLSDRLRSGRGEFTVAIDLGEGVRKPTDIGQLPDNDAPLRRQVVKRLAQQLGLSSNRLYRAIEDAKKIGLSPEDNDDE